MCRVESVHPVLSVGSSGLVVTRSPGRSAFARRWIHRSLLLVPTSLVVAPAWSPAAAQQEAFALEGLVITAASRPLEAAAVPNHVTVVTGEELRALGDRTLGEALRDVVGVHGSYGGAVVDEGADVGVADEASPCLAV